MEDDYLSSALRHLVDCQTLEAQNRPHNAAYLAGYVIECGLKRVLEVYGHSARAYGHDLSNLNGRALHLAALLSPGIARYRIDRLNLGAVIGLWGPNMRYSTSGDVTPPIASALVHAARRVGTGILTPLILDDSTTRIR